MELEDAVRYVAAAYLVAWVTILVYVGLIGAKVGRLERELDRLEREVADRASEPAPTPVRDRTAGPVA